MPTGKPVAGRLWVSLRAWRLAALIGTVGALAAVGAVPALANPPEAATLLSVVKNTSALSGVTLDSRGRLLSGVEVRLAPLGAVANQLPVLKVLSDDEGRFQLLSLVPGTYRVVAVKGGYTAFVGQVNTLFQNTLELILRPSGVPGLPGARPVDSSWVLRLPRRDPLEDQQFSPTETAATAPAFSSWGPGGDLPAFQLEIFSGRDFSTRNFQTASAQGNRDYSLNARLPLDGSNRLSAQLSRSDQRRGPAFSDRQERIQFRWGFLDAEQANFDGRLDLNRQDARWTPDPESRPAESQQRVFDQVRMVFSRSRQTDDFFQGLSFGFSWGRQNRVRGGTLRPDSQALGLSAALLQKRTFPDGQEWEFKVEVRGFDRNGETNEAGDVLWFDIPIDPESSSLLDQAGNGVDLMVARRWRPGEHLSLEARARADWNNQFSDGAWGNAGIGLIWEAVPGLSFRAMGGIVTGGDQAGQKVAELATQADWGPLSVSVSCGRESGLNLATESGGTFPGAPLLLTGPDGMTDRWQAEVTWRPVSLGLMLQINGEHTAFNGTLVPRVAGDFPLVPLQAEGEARGDRLATTFWVSRWGTQIQVVWDRLENLSGTSFLEGASLWDRRLVSIRQRITGWGRNGVTVDLVLLGEENRLGGDAPHSSLRALAIERRRVSGGMALTF